MMITAIVQSAKPEDTLLSPVGSVGAALPKHVDTPTKPRKVEHLFMYGKI